MAAKDGRKSKLTPEQLDWVVSLMRAKQLTVREIARLSGVTPNTLCRYLAPSLKGSTEVDWSDPEVRRGFLAEIVTNAERLLGQAPTSPHAADRAGPARPQIMAAAELLCQLLLQDMDRRPDGVVVWELDFVQSRHQR